MFPQLIDGKVWVPMRAETDGVIGDALVELSPDDPGFEQVKAWLEANAQ